MTVIELGRIIQDPQILTPDLVKPAFRGGHYLAGHCYAAVEAIWHTAKDRDDWTPYRVMVGSVPHWYLKRGTEVVDPTAAQFEGKKVDYDSGRASRFLTKSPSARAKVVMSRLAAKL